MNTTTSITTEGLKKHVVNGSVSADTDTGASISDLKPQMLLLVKDP